MVATSIDRVCAHNPPSGDPEHPMNKYLSIIDLKTLSLSLVCVVVTYLCYAFHIAYNLNITLFSIAVIFPLVFTIREAFKRRDNALEYLSQFKSALGSVDYCFARCKKLGAAEQHEIRQLLQTVSAQFFEALGSSTGTIGPATETVDDIVRFIRRNDCNIPGSMALKIIRFLEDVKDGMENTISIKTHGTPVSMRAYCLVFIYTFPFVFAPTIVYHLPDAPPAISYGLSVLHGFILISLYNVQMQIENPFDQIGLDDIQLENFHFQGMLSDSVSSAPPAS